MWRIMTLVALTLVGWMLWRSGSVVPYATDYTVPAASDMVTSEPASGPAILRVTANPYTVNNEPWDGSDSFGGMLGPFFASVGLSSPPDLTACVHVGDKGEPTHCFTQIRDGKPGSFCVNAYSCDWDLVLPIAESFALTIFDIDDGWLEGPWDFVDAIIVSDDGNAEKLERLDVVVRDFISRTSPTEMPRPDFVPNGPPILFNAGEKYRRERPFYFTSRTEIAAGQTVQQSTIQLVFQ
jgi:hypothetical protein